LLCGFLVRSLTRIVAGLFPAHRRASPVVCSDNGFSAPPCGTAPLGTDVTGFFMSIMPVCPRPTMSTTATATAAKMASALFILGLRGHSRNNPSMPGLFRQHGSVSSSKSGRGAPNILGPATIESLE
jgi:hypothetical protein